MFRSILVLCSVSGSAVPDGAGGHPAVGGDQGGVLGRVGQVRWEFSGAHATSSAPPHILQLLPHPSSPLPVTFQVMA